MVPKENKNNAYAKFGGQTKSIMVFSGMANLQGAFRHGPGVWKFNKSLLQDEDFCSLIYDLIEHFLNSRSSFPSDLILWDRLKEEIKLVCCLLYTSPSPRDLSTSRMPSSA